ncbi:O-methyltransferase [Streptomyces sp. PanSC19]|uniref:methyltransferase n=1 Tax=Streptomyces sp. PanSC19 TaxID=1520455 RepID=UPI000F48397A|nr:methyltransferase [Streptomyces sp. PanSC19]ROQ35932.1 O-methyltransferase [Streptomyces sp. PanSC19]
MTTDPQAVRDAVELVTGAWRTQTVHVAARLRLPDLVAGGHRDPAALAAATGLREDLVRRLLRLLVLLGVFETDGDGAVATTPVGELLRDRPGSLRDMALLYGEEFYRAWEHAEEALITGTSGFELAHGEPLLSYLAGDREAAGRFQRVMQAGHAVFEAVPGVLDLTGRERVVDVGGGSGRLLAAVLAAAPRTRGVLVDLPHTLPHARAHLAATVGLDRVELHGRDMFAEPLPAGGDVYVLSRVLGDWDDGHCVRLLRRVRAELSPRARLLVVERMATDDGSGPLAALWDLHLLVVNGGRQRTLDDYRTLLHRSGLALERVVELPLETKGLLVAAAGPARGTREKRLGAVSWSGSKRPHGGR